MIKEKLDSFNKLKEEISKYFNTPIYEGFDDMRHVEVWKISNDEIGWNESADFDDSEGFEYGGEIYGTSIWEKEEYTLIRYDNGCGEKIYAVFDNSTRVYPM